MNKTGVVVLRLPTEHINKAAEDPESDEAKTLETLKQSAALMHSGDQTFILLGSDTQGENGNGKYTYDFSLQGVEGSQGQSVSTSEFINERKKAILDVFGAGFVNLGNDSHGSYALADSKTSLHAFFMERHLLFIKSVIENDLIVQLAQLNEVFLEEADIPTFEYGEFDSVDPEVFSKVGQRLGAVGLIPKYKPFLMDLWQKCGLDTSDIAELPEEDILKLLTEFTSRSGDGMEEGMGNGTGGAGNNNSSTNSENAS